MILKDIVPRCNLVIWEKGSCSFPSIVVIVVGVVPKRDALNTTTVLGLVATTCLYDIHTKVILYTCLALVAISEWGNGQTLRTALACCRVVKWKHI